MKPNFDRIANAYSLLERLTFGSTLQKTREHGLLAIEPNRPTRALILGDGDGRFAATALSRYPLLTIESIDSSESMLKAANKRIQRLGPNCSKRYQSRLQNALEYPYGENEYELIVAQFFLDCFSSEEANQLISELHSVLKPNGRFVYADFAIAEKAPWKAFSYCAVWTLYRLFGLMTSLPTKRLPRIQWPDTLNVEFRRTALKGMLTSEIRVMEPRP